MAPDFEGDNMGGVERRLEGRGREDRREDASNASSLSLAKMHSSHMHHSMADQSR